MSRDNFLRSKELSHSFVLSLLARYEPPTSVAARDLTDPDPGEFACTGCGRDDLQLVSTSLVAAKLEEMSWFVLSLP